MLANTCTCKPVRCIEYPLEFSKRMFFRILRYYTIFQTLTLETSSSQHARHCIKLLSVLGILPLLPLELSVTKCLAVIPHLNALVLMMQIGDAYYSRVLATRSQPVAYFTKFTATPLQSVSLSDSVHHFLTVYATLCRTSCATL